MTLLQGIIQAIASTFFEILPNGGEFHRELLIQTFGWEHPTSTLLGVFQLSAFLALFFTFRSEWASIFSESLQTLLFQKKQGTLDERMPLFLAVALIPGLLVSHFYSEQVNELSISAYFKAILYFGLGLPLLLVERKNKKTKSYCDWNWIDSLVVGIFGALFVVPGAGLTLGLLLGALFRNYKREAAVKFVLLVANLFLLIQGLVNISEVKDLHELPGLTNLNWIAIVLTITTSITASIFGIKFFLKNIEFKTFKNYAFYRGLIAVCSIVAFWFRNH